MKVKILSTESVTHDVKRFVVEKPKGYKFIPGQATLVSISKPKWEKEKRPFTFTSLNDDKNLEFIIKIYPLNKNPDHGGMTEQLRKIEVGDELIIGKPRGAIKYKGPGVFVAGGAGITPFIAIFRQLKKGGKMKGNKLIFSNKTKKDVILEKEFKEIFNPGDLILTLTKEKLNDYEHGRVDGDFLKKHVGDFSQNFYVCGPKQMVSDIDAVLKNLGAKLDSIVFEK